jgi:hypothetical protein
MTALAARAEDDGPYTYLSCPTFEARCKSSADLTAEGREEGKGGAGLEEKVAGLDEKVAHLGGEEACLVGVQTSGAWTATLPIHEAPEEVVVEAAKVGPFRVEAGALVAAASAPEPTLSDFRCLGRCSRLSSSPRVWLGHLGVGLASRLPKTYSVIFRFSKWCGTSCFY